MDKNQKNDTASPELPLPPQPEDDGIDLQELLGTLLEARWLIGAIAGGVFVVGVIYALLATPIYRSDALVQVESKDGMGRGMKDITALFTGETPTETEIEVIRSRLVVGNAVEELGLDIDVAPRHFPLLGRWVARMNGEEKLSSAFLGMSGFAWGGERLRIGRLQVPRDTEDQPLALVAGEGGKFRLLDPDGELLAEGVAGKAAQGTRGVSLFVSDLRARPGTEFHVIKRSTLKTLSALQTDLAVKEKGKKTGVIEVALEGADPARTATIVQAVVTAYVRQNVERRSAEAQKMLEFLNTQLPRLKGEVQGAETALGQYRSKQGAVDVSMEAHAFLQHLTELEKQLAFASLQRVELEQKFTGQHPALMALKEKIAELESEKARIDAGFRNLPEAELQALRLQRDAKVANEVYVALMNKAQELSVAKAGSIGNVRILDSAVVPLSPIKPKKSLVAMLSLVLGVFLGVGVAFARRALFKGVEDPDQVEKRLGIPVYATVPHSQKQHEVDAMRAKTGGGHGLLAHVAPQDVSIESVRSLRTSLQFALLDSPNNIIMITGPSPGCGKSFVSANLAATLAEAGKKVLLIDADMRKGHLHEYFGLKRTYGLSGLLSGEVPPAKAMHDTQVTNLSFIPAGIVPPNPAELLMSDRFREMLHKAAGLFDNVIIDTPPVLAVTDPTIVGRLAGINFIVLRAGVHHLREIDLCYKRLVQNGVKPQGVVFNDISVGRGRYGYRYGKYGHSYTYHYEYK
ncbi:MAG: polysaccharide biosynthesis tyrosine autokinase [Betaproteobacteria bacterium]|nr:polysaccharide biosynthesis tyrosine autokinase [Betaproteobacteria bacterium]